VKEARGDLAGQKGGRPPSRQGRVRRNQRPVARPAARQLRDSEAPPAPARPGRGVQPSSSRLSPRRNRLASAAPPRAPRSSAPATLWRPQRHTGPPDASGEPTCWRTHTSQPELDAPNWARARQRAPQESSGSSGDRAPPRRQEPCTGASQSPRSRDVASRVSSHKGDHFLDHRKPIHRPLMFRRRELPLDRPADRMASSGAPTKSSCSLASPHTESSSFSKLERYLHL